MRHSIDLRSLKSPGCPENDDTGQRNWKKSESESEKDEEGEDIHLKQLPRLLLRETYIAN
jgi:hypothetical protein